MGIKDYRNSRLYHVMTSNSSYVFHERVMLVHSLRRGLPSVGKGMSQD